MKVIRFNVMALMCAESVNEVKLQGNEFPLAIQIDFSDGTPPVRMIAGEEAIKEDFDALIDGLVLIAKKCAKEDKDH
jgi:hypothetical protein